ncbi:PAS domain-containing sensor histidine kinase [Hymenobacter radiodurans]|uniref:PAS domain-containing sensor histidine kinase n=1 Tax=Hymenobacter radiodurans TaxID=2496028 RepID=UPI001058A49C|nr:PAS domain-containing protein [Hymenobacter radiodurans]
MTPLTTPGLPATTLPALLDLLPNGIVYYTSVLDADGRAVDFRFAYLNATAQRTLGLPAQPTVTFLEQWPDSATNGAFAFCHDTYLTGTPAQFDQFYQASGDNFIRAYAQRLEEGLLVSFSDGGEHAPSAAALALRESQAREQQARAEADAQKATLQATLEQAPVAIAILDGPEHVVTFANEGMGWLWGRPITQIIGRPHFEALPDLTGQGFEAIFADVYHTGNPYHLHEQWVQIDRVGTGELIPGYFNIVYQPLRDIQQTITGIIASATEVTAQVEARQGVEQLNHDLEVRVQERTRRLEEQQGLLSQILGQVPAAVATLTGPDHRFAFFNNQYSTLTGNRPVLYKTAAEVLPEVVEQGFLSLLDRVYSSGEPFIGKEIAILLDQPTGPPLQHYVDFIYQPLKDSQGQTQGILAFILDTTEAVRTRRQAEALQAKALIAVQRRAQERQELLSLFERAPVAVALLREPNHRIEYFNDSFAQLYPADNLRGRTVLEVYPNMATSDVIGRLDRVYQTGEMYQGLEQPLRTATPGGPPRYITFTYQAYRENDRIAGVAVFIHEVTEQVRARQAREAQQQLVESVFEQSPTAIFVVEGPNYVFNIVNPLMEQILGRRREQLVGQPYFEVLPELVSQGVPELLNQVWQIGKTLVVKEMPAQLPYHQPDSPGYFSFVFEPLRDAQDQVVRIACVAIDVTDQVVARQQVHALNKELAATNKELNDTNTRLSRTNADLDTFVYTASHDLKAPISNIEGLLLALRQQLPPEAQQAPLVPRLLDMMEGSVTRFQQTIGHLTDISQLQRAEVAEMVDLTNLIEGVRLDLAPILEAAPATLSVTVNGCEAVRVAPKTLRSVVYNLLSNAVKYCAPDRPAQVLLQAHCLPDHLVITVQDNGLGLTAAQQGELFGMFRRLHTHVEGSGVGLFMVKRLVDNAGGTITVESQPGVGSTFTVSLPA